jgi:hypothetical protein
MTPLEQALAYAELGWAVFPCRPNKKPYTANGFHDASRDPDRIRKWWIRWPGALIGCPTGRINGFVVLDVDTKNPRAYGFHTLDDLGFAILPDTRMAHTPSGGLHIHFTLPEKPFAGTVGDKGRGIGAGLDWRAEGNYVILPGPGSGYSWDPHLGIETPLVDVPGTLLPRAPAQPVNHHPARPVIGLDRYAEAALDKACRAIITAYSPDQEATLTREVFSIGTLAGAGGIPTDFARDVLHWAAQKIPSYDPKRPWRANEIRSKVDRAFAAGMHRPRGARHA